MSLFLFHKNTIPLCFLPDGKLVCYQGGDVIVFEDKVEVKRIRVFGSFKERFLSRSKLLSRFLRFGVRTSEAISLSRILLALGNMLYELDLETGKLSNGFFCGEGIRPLIFTTAKGIEGIDDSIYFGGYLGNDEMKPVSIYKRLDTDNWEKVYTFDEGTINHVHNIVSDPYHNCLWAFTGDFGEASAIWRITENFKKVERVVFNNQKYRGCVVYALPEGLLYATDAPFADDFIYLMNPKTYEVKEICPIDGSCIYGCQWKNKYVFSSTVEGDGRNMSRIEWLFTRKRGAGIKDDYVHMYLGNLKDGFREIYKEKKDGMPYYTFQFGVFKFPYGINYSEVLYFQPVATKNNDQDLMVYSE